MQRAFAYASCRSRSKISWSEPLGSLRRSGHSRHAAAHLQRLNVRDRSRAVPAVSDLGTLGHRQSAGGDAVLEHFELLMHKPLLEFVRLVPKLQSARMGCHRDKLMRRDCTPEVLRSNDLFK